MKLKTVISKMLAIMIIITSIGSMPITKVHADSFKVVTLGANLTESQKEEMLKYFGVNRKEANVLEVNIQEENKYLKGVATEKQLGSRSISCSYVEPTSNGGLNVTTKNIYWVTDKMIKNALITAGIENANVKAAAPFNVSGTAALTGILKGFENSKGGKKIDEKKKKTANEEMVVTGNLGEKIGQDKAAGLINEVKKDVIKEKPKTEKEIEKIVLNVTNNFNQNLSQDDINKITELMKKINGLNLNFNQIKDQLNSVTQQLKGTLTSDEAKGFFTKMWIAIRNFFDGIFGSGNKTDSNNADSNNADSNTKTNNETQPQTGN